MQKLPVKPIEVFPDGTIRNGHARLALLAPGATVTVVVVMPSAKDDTLRRRIRRMVKRERR